VIVIVLLIALLVLAFASVTLAAGVKAPCLPAQCSWCHLACVLARIGALAMRQVAPRFLTFAWRQGLANLHRPSNQTTAVMLAIGLGHLS